MTTDRNILSSWWPVNQVQSGKITSGGPQIVYEDASSIHATHFFVCEVTRQIHLLPTNMYQRTNRSRYGRMIRLMNKLM